MRWFLLAALAIACVAGLTVEDIKKGDKKAGKHHKKHHGKHHGKHHHHHHHHHGKHHKADAEHAVAHDAAHADSKHGYMPSAPETVLPMKAGSNPLNQHGVVNVVAKATQKAPAMQKASVGKSKGKETEEDSIVKKMKVLEEKLQKKKLEEKVEKQGQILVNGPLPADFHQLFAAAVSQAVGVDAKTIKVLKTETSQGGVVSVTFTASPHTVGTVEQEVSDPDSKLANGKLHSFLVSKGDDDEDEKQAEPQAPQEKQPAAAQEDAVTPVEEKGIDIDTAMPYGDLEPFGREDTAQELTEDSIKESDDMVDQLERAEVAEEKRAVFRALTRLRGAAITSFDGVARSQTGNIDEYNKIHKWRESHPLHHLADEESDISKWAFPDNADF